MRQRLLIPTRLRRYLQAQPDQARAAGRPADCYQCILACWLQAELAAAPGDIWVGETTWYDARERRHVLPDWAQHFVALADRRARAQGCPLTIAEALEVVDRVARYACGA